MHDCDKRLTLEVFWMTICKRQFHSRVKGPWMESEDWWLLVYDTYAHRLTVEHEWSYMRPGEFKTASGIENVELNEWLSREARTTAKRSRREN